jgi:glycosyltransferase involved in cell wall biosynthesis
VVDGLTGIQVDPTDECAIADAIVSLLRDPQRAEDLGRRGHARVRQAFTWERTAEEYGRFLGSTLSETKR